MAGKKGRRRRVIRLRFAICLGFVACVGISRNEKSSEQVAAEQALIGRRTALLERENQVLREENLDLTRANELNRAELQKHQADANARDEKRSAEIATLSTNLKNLQEKITILESESGGKIKQLTALNAELAQKSAELQKKLQDDLARAQIEAAAEKERLTREAAEARFTLGKEMQELKQRLADREKESEELRKRIAELRDNETKLQKELADLKSRPVVPVTETQPKP